MEDELSYKDFLLNYISKENENDVNTKQVKNEAEYHYDSILLENSNISYLIKEDLNNININTIKTYDVLINNKFKSALTKFYGNEI